MKHIVTLTISNPAHEHVSLRRRQSTTNYMVEARDEAEAIFRASNHFKKLGNYVHNAVIAEGYMKNTLPDDKDTGESDVAEYERHMDKKPGVKAYDKEGSLVGHYRSMADAKKFKPGHTYKEIKEEIEQVEEETRLPPKFYKKIVDKLNKKKAGMKEDVEQIDELTKKFLVSPPGDDGKGGYGSKAIRAHLAAKASGDTATADKRARGYNLAQAKAFPGQYVKSPNKAKVPATNEEIEQVEEEKNRQVEPPPEAMPSDTRIKPLPKAKKGVRIGSTNKFGNYTPGVREEVEQVSEVLKPSMGASAYIHDFVHSDNPKFAGKTKAERTKMALGAFYAAKKGK